MAYPISPHYYYFCLKVGECYKPDGIFHTQSSSVDCICILTKTESLQSPRLCKKLLFMKNVTSLGQMILMPVHKTANELKPVPTFLFLVFILTNSF